jgi:D-tyrosyl-tRNA(Tyr) deacylase
MRAVVTRVTHASVAIDGAVHGKIGPGFLILLGVTHEDTEEQAKKLADKICSLRIFEDAQGKMNLGLDAVSGELLVISQFTLYGSCRHGRRPDFLAAARPEIANPLYEKFVALCRENGFHTETGVFGADMKVDSLNDGPLTLILDTDTL